MKHRRSHLPGKDSSYCTFFCRRSKQGLCPSGAPGASEASALVHASNLRKDTRLIRRPCT
ncbi:hypothetical protein KNP414_05234 [Paenibacillus mucilaginosus KNP414]|uniref:Uncharacterized protein n=1 Tax=Paenibacillus mucilaginosus (strain KNP414) TaxID=1036673 RepID=F8FBZ7_PAEMK|nr:hypothetical protein KNP414_05234 [Paenibacillus mucilaginosus KNP414]